MAKKVAQIIEEQIQFWRLKNDPSSTGYSPHKKLPVITVSREFGAKGAALSLLVGEKLGFKVWDKELLDLIGNKLGSNKEYLQSLDENRRSLLEDALFGFMNNKGTNLNYLIYLVKAIRKIEQLGNSIIVGRGANFICRDKSSFHIRIVSPLEQRVEDYAMKEELSKKMALKIINQKDAERAKFTKLNFNKDIELSNNYDLVLNSASFPLETMAEIIDTAYACKIMDRKKLYLSKAIL